MLDGKNLGAMPIEHQDYQKWIETNTISSSLVVLEVLNCEEKHVICKTEELVGLWPPLEPIGKISHKDLAASATSRAGDLRSAMQVKSLKQWRDKNERSRKQRKNG